MEQTIELAHDFMFQELQWLTLLTVDLLKPNALNIPTHQHQICILALVL